MKKEIKLIKGDCLKEMDNLIEQGVKVDAVICDPPYGTTACKWDSVIPFDEMWLRLKALRKDRTPIVLFGSEPFSSALRMSNIKEYKYDLIWEKTRPSNSMMAYKRPLNTHENIHLFYKKQPNYYPQKWKIDERFIDRRRKHEQKNYKHNIVGVKIKTKNRPIDDGFRFPMSVIPIKSTSNQVHPTQKPLKLMEYLVLTYTNECDTVLDFTMGSGTTGVACKNLNRNFVGIEKEDNYFEIATNRIEEIDLKKNPLKAWGI